MKKFFVFFILCLGLFLTGWKFNKPAVIFSATPISKEEGYTPSNTFQIGDKIYYAVYNPKGFKTRLLKLQVFKKSDNNSEFFGYEYLYNKTIELKNKNTYTNYIVINNKGYYIFQFFDYTNFQEPVVLGIIRVE